MPKPATAPTARPVPRAALLRPPAPAGSTGHWRARQALWLGIAGSIAVHALALSVGFIAPEPIRWKAPDKPLDIVLVNARHRSKPIKPDAYAQANLDGGGNTDEKRRAKTPLPPSPVDRQGDQLVDKQRRIKELEAAQKKLLSEVRSAAKVISDEQRTEQPEPEPRLSGLDLAASARALARKEAEIARNVDDYNRKPKKKFVGARVAEYEYAMYIEQWREKVQKIGTLNYPTEARGRIYGNVQVTVEIRADGELEEVHIARSSGKKLLDEAALRIIRMASPFGPLPRSQETVDVLSITRTLIFTDKLASE